VPLPRSRYWGRFRSIAQLALVASPLLNTIQLMPGTLWTAKSAIADGRKSPIFMDDEVIGFGVQVRETGRKSFALDYMFEGRRLYIGALPIDRLRQHANTPS
jgi:hypothetical protein